MYIDAKYAKCSEIPQLGANCEVSTEVGSRIYRHMHLFYSDSVLEWRICVNGKPLVFKPVIEPKVGLRSFSDEYKWYQPLGDW